MTLPVVILAGGKATRLYPLTKNKPKSLILIDGKPFIEHQLELLVKNGIKEVVLYIGHFGEKIKDRIGNGHSFGLHIEYSRDIDRGTGGAIKKALYLLGEQFGVLYGDSYLEINYRKIMKHFQEKTYMGLMTIFSNKICQDENNVVVDDGLVTRYEKKLCKEYVDYGFGIFKSKIFEHILLGDRKSVV